MKRVILCLDGTWNDNKAGSILTNVAKLHHAILPRDAGGIQQVTHYVDGIASTAGESVQFLKGAVGFGVGDRIRRAYELLATDYEPGDEIYLFGFSRGAFEARSLGALITLFGVAKSVTGFPYATAWSLYRTRDAKRSRSAMAGVRAAAHYPVRIKCVGVWDTVGNIGNPFTSSRMFKFHDTTLSDSIDVGLHALSIDEVRGPFRPALWSLAKGERLADHQHVEQVWFAGSHCDVGGGFRETGLSDISLLWMAERAAATTGLAFDTQELANTTWPDALGPQHRSATGSIFGWSRVFPFVRLVKQVVEGLSPLRRRLFGSLRSTKVRDGSVVVNETIHESVLQRFGQKVIELYDARSHMIEYRPANLRPVVSPPSTLTRSEPASNRLRRVKIFTVHGTFAHGTTWDDWDAKDNAKNAQRAFINLLADHLQKLGFYVEELDHTQYDWSGGNSHDERRVAAIGLKKMIQNELTKSYEQHGQDYYDKVFIIAHSHGGTISRLAMNLWDKDDDYYDPVKSATIDELKHDDECSTCLRVRNGRVGRNTARRPDGVITFGSPFVTFDTRSGGLLTARLSAWVFRILAAAPLVVILLLAHYVASAEGIVGFFWSLTFPFVKNILLLLWPLALCWLVASYLPRRLGVWERSIGKGRLFMGLSTFFQGVRYLVFVGTAIFYVAYFTGQLDRFINWLPLSSDSTRSALSWVHLLTIFFFVVVALPGSFLSWLSREVVGLRGRLPTKYDPAEDRPVSYVSYHTPGDEAGLHLHIFGFITWIVRTLAASAASVLAFGILLVLVIAIEAAFGLSQGGSFLSKIGISAVSAVPEDRDRFITLLDSLTYFPKVVWSDLLGWPWFPTLGGLENRRAVAWFIPLALILAILFVFVLLMPFVVVGIAIAYLVSMWLRGTGVVFGSEKLSWNLANDISVTRYPNKNTTLRVLFISLQAWRQGEIAHSYYYKSGRIIADVAQQIANWDRLQPTNPWPLVSWVGTAARSAIVLLFVLSIFAVSIPIASALATNLASPLQFLFGLNIGTVSDSKQAPKLIEQAARVCWSEAHSVRVPIVTRDGQTDGDAIRNNAKPVWEAEVASKFGAEWGSWDFSAAGQGTSWSCDGQQCFVALAPCRPRAIQCKETPHASEVKFELGASFDSAMRVNVVSSIKSDLQNKWRDEVAQRFGAEWTTTARNNFEVLRAFGHSIEEGCSERSSQEGAVSYECRLKATPCLEPVSLQNTPSAPVISPASSGNR